MTRTEQFANDFHAIKQNVIHNCERCQTLCHCDVKIGSQTFAVTVNDALLQELFNGPVGAVFANRLNHIDISEDLQQFLEGVVVLGATVVNEIEAHLLMLFGHA